MDPALDSLLRRVLRDDETLWWSGRPSPKRMMMAVSPLPLLGLVVLGMAGYIAALDRLLPGDQLLVRTAAAAAMALGALLLLAPLLVLLGTSRMSYAITSRRLIVVTRWPWPSVKSWEAAQLPAFSRVDSTDGSGDIRFGGRMRSRPMALVGLSDAPTAQRLLENLRRRSVR